MRLGRGSGTRKDLRAPGPDAMPQTPEIRRQRSVLSISGGGVIVFAVWNILKSVITILINGSEVDPAQSDEFFERLGITPDMAASHALVLLAILLAITLLGIVSLVLRIYIGRAALAEGRGERRSLWYVVWAGILLVFGTIVNVVISAFFGGFGAVDDFLVSLIVDLMTTVMLIDLIVAAIRLRKLIRKAHEGEV